LDLSIGDHPSPHVGILNPEGGGGRREVKKKSIFCVTRKGGGGRGARHLIKKAFRKDFLYLLAFGRGISLVIKRGKGAGGKFGVDDFSIRTKRGRLPLHSLRTRDDFPFHRKKKGEEAKKKVRKNEGKQLLLSWGSSQKKKKIFTGEDLHQISYRARRKGNCFDTRWIKRRVEKIAIDNNDWKEAKGFDSVLFISENRKLRTYVLWRA